MSDVDISTAVIMRYLSDWLAGEMPNSKFAHWSHAVVATLRHELTATQEKLAAAEAEAERNQWFQSAKETSDELLKVCKELTTAQAQIDAARNEGLEMAIAHFRSTFINNRTIGRVLAELEALKSTAPVRDDAWALRLIAYTLDNGWDKPIRDTLAAFNAQDNSNE